MLNEFIDFVENVLPAVPTESAENTKKAIEQFNGDYTLSTTAILPEFSQGDMLSEIKFFEYENDGQLIKEEKEKIMKIEAIKIK